MMTARGYWHNITIEMYGVKRQTITLTSTGKAGGRKSTVAKNYLAHETDGGVMSIESTLCVGFFTTKLLSQSY